MLQFNYVFVHFRSGNEIERDPNRPRSRLMLDGLKTFLNYIIRLRKTRIDFKECWKQYHGKDLVFNKSSYGVFTPYDPNSNLLEGVSDDFYRAMKIAASRSKSILCNGQNEFRYPEYLVSKVFQAHPAIGYIHDLSEMEFIIEVRNCYCSYNRFPSITYGRQNQDSTDRTKTSFYKQFMKILGADMLLSSYTEPTIDTLHFAECGINSIIGDTLEWSDTNQNHSKYSIKYKFHVKPPNEQIDSANWKEVIFSLK